MPELANSALELLSIEIPAWLRQAISPWQVEEAKVGSKGVELVLRSERARVPLRLALTSDGSLRTSLLDARISRAKAAALVRALELRLQARPLHEWLTKLQTLAERLDRGSLRDDDPSLACWYDAWRVWPGHEHSPREQIDELPTAIWAHTSELPRTILAALALHRIGRGELLEALTIWDSLPPASAEPGLTELHLDAVALGLLGRRSEALARLARAEANAVQPEEWLTIARVYETLDDREAAVAAHERVIALRGHGWDRLRLAMARGALVPGEARPRPDPAGLLYERVSFARQLVKILDATGRYDDQLEVIAEFADAAPPDLVLRAARLHLWRGELAQARARVESLPAKPRDPKAQMILAATAVLEGRPFLALELLEQIPGREPLERLLWQAEAHLALGQIEDAIECLDRHIVLENSLAAYLLKLIALVRWDPDKALNSSIDQRTFLDALVLEVLPTLRPASQIAAARTHPDHFTALLRGILDEMAGNRSATPTWCRRGADGIVRLEPVAMRRPGREAAVDQLRRICTEPPEAVLAGFDALTHEYAQSPHPYTYRGELLIWLGRYQQALDSFARADERALTRWSYVGRAAAYDLLGQAEQAEHWTLAGVQQFGELETATTHVYRGERLRKLGAWQDARRDLETALAYKTRRIGARINLALSYRALGEQQAWTQQLDRLRADAPAYLWEVGVRADQPIDESTLLAMLELMVGNRSSFLHTMIDRDGQFRVIPDPARWVAHARLCLGRGRDELGRAITTRGLGRK